MLRRSDLRAAHACGLAALLGAAVLAGCTGRHDPERTLLRMGDGLHDLFSGNTNAPEETLRFESVGVVAVDVDAFAGDVVVIERPGASEIVVTVAREGMHGFMRQGEAREALRTIAATAEMTPGALGPLLSVRIDDPGGESHFLRGHVRIEAPSIEGVRVRTGRGNVSLRDVSGAVEVETGDGAVRFISSRPLRRPVVVASRNGPIDFRVTGDSHGVIDAETVGGVVRGRCTDGGWVVRRDEGGRGRFVATLNEGTTPFTLRAVDADIRIAVVAEPEAVGAMIVDP